MLLGVIAGVTAATFQSGGYIFSRIFIRKTGRTEMLLFYTQILMAGFSVFVLPFAWQDGFWGDWRFVWPLLGTACGSLFGQLFFFQAEKSIEASRVASLMGLRVVLLAIVSASLGLERYDAWQIVAVTLAALSALMMNYQNGHIAWQGMPCFGMALLFYCLSDLSIKFMIDSLRVPHLFQASLLAMCLVNFLLGLPSLLILLRTGMERTLLIAALPFAGSWSIKQIALYSCYALVGPVFGNVILTCRGPISIGLTLILVHFHVKYLGDHADVATWVRRSLATLLMILAIVLYSYSPMVL